MSQSLTQRGSLVTGGSGRGGKQEETEVDSKQATEGAKRVEHFENQ